MLSLQSHLIISFLHWVSTLVVILVCPSLRRCDSHKIGYMSLIALINLKIDRLRWILLRWPLVKVRFWINRLPTVLCHQIISSSVLNQDFTEIVLLLSRKSTATLTCHFTNAIQASACICRRCCERLRRLDLGLWRLCVSSWMRNFPIKSVTSLC